MRIEREPDIVASFLSDAAHVAGGHAQGVAFPTSVLEVAEIVGSARTVLPVGAQSSLTGGATPRGEVVLSTRHLNHLELESDETVTVGAGVPLSRLQDVLGAHGLWYPPAPTFNGAFVGGTIATNAAGAATFKYGATRAWVEKITVVLADGSVHEISRDDSPVWPRIPVPTYQMPPTVKLSAGYFARPGMDLIDLFIGSEGTLGIITSATLRVRRRPHRTLALITCGSDAQAVDVTAALRGAAAAGWAGRGPLDVAAIEYMDAPSLGYVDSAAFARCGVPRPAAGEVLLLAQLELQGGPKTAPDDPGMNAMLEALQALLDRCKVTADPVVTAPDDVRAAERLFALREAVPAGVNAAIAAVKARLGDGIEKTAGDMIVPFERLAESLALYRRVFDSYGLEHAIWGHVSDGNLHPNVIPSSLDDVTRGREALLEIAQAVMAIGGAPLAEHGVGRSALKQRLLLELYGAQGIEQMRAVKRALDPEWKLAPGVLFGPGVPGKPRA
jgi:D-lactate dehydrogenase (cytochrome)